MDVLKEFALHIVAGKGDEMAREMYNAVVDGAPQCADFHELQPVVIEAFNNGDKSIAVNDGLLASLLAQNILAEDEDGNLPSKADELVRLSAAIQLVQFFIKLYREEGEKTSPASPLN